ncbi:NAD(P)H-dependent FMN reductase [Nonomuraea solani]|uniref:NAD(P)H-dependent FMN reductase n=1 Tax=Nonomuraea solani TaxID=1144553 RepID=A0A1H6F499_9ACTN|nr:NAD(P)H-dependent oxidoreductase [Nonomuraea solani]SEH03804.1 NAD(P)H-dependent FMN reductase [Nonomuraea solani]
MRILLICGSVRGGSVNEAMLRTTTVIAPKGVTTSLFQGLATLPHFNPDDDHHPLPPTVIDLRLHIEQADALLFCTPEYAGGLPGPFKNLLDWTVGGVEISDKPCAWINVSIASTGALPAHDSLRRVLGYAGARIVEEACGRIPLPRHLVGPDGLVHDAAIRGELLTKLTALIEIA